MSSAANEAMRQGHMVKNITPSFTQLSAQWSMLLAQSTFEWTASSLLKA